MTAEELLKPRFKIIADFPDNYFGNVGTVLDRDWAKYPNDDETKKAIWRISEFPHLFQKLKWWEERQESEMPKKVKSLAFPDDIMVIEKWDMDMLFGFTNVEKREGCSLESWKPEYGYVPVD